MPLITNANAKASKCEKSHASDRKSFAQNTCEKLAHLTSSLRRPFRLHCGQLTFSSVACIDFTASAYVKQRLRTRSKYKILIYVKAKDISGSFIFASDRANGKINDTQNLDLHFRSLKSRHTLIQAPIVRYEFTSLLALLCVTLTVHEFTL